MQIMEKIESLTKFSKEQLEYIKQLKDKINNLNKRDRNAELNLAPSNQPTMASRIAAFANSNLAFDVLALPSFFEPTLPKCIRGLHLSINFSRCIFMIIHHSLSNLCNHLQALLFAFYNIKDVKVKRINQDAKNS